MTELLRQWTIYEHPDDWPEWYVVREFRITREGVEPSPVATLAVDLETARKIVPQGLYCLGRAPDDDPCIAEVWI